MVDSNKVDINFNAETWKASGDVREFKGEIEAVGPSGEKVAARTSGAFKIVESSIGKVKKALGAFSFGAMMVESVVNLANKFRAWRVGGKDRIRRFAGYTHTAEFGICDGVSA